jgi:hypothetical protein
MLLDVYDPTRRYGSSAQLLIGLSQLVPSERWSSVRYHTRSPYSSMKVECPPGTGTSRIVSETFDSSHAHIYECGSGPGLPPAATIASRSR